jgi:2C-methyl-D-erythritol 2,4-cyclodiphosphate synthase
MKKKLDTSTKVGRIIFQMKDISVRMKPEVRAIVIRVFNTLEADQTDTALRFKLREDLTKLGREPQLASLARMLFKELPST